MTDITPEQKAAYQAIADNLPKVGKMTNKDECKVCRGYGVVSKPPYDDAQDCPKCSSMAGGFDTVPPAATSRDDWQRVREAIRNIERIEENHRELKQCTDNNQAVALIKHNNTMYAQRREALAICERNLKE